MLKNALYSMFSVGRGLLFRRKLAEAVGFEPTVGFHPRSVSNRVLSASQPRLRPASSSNPSVRGQG